MFCRFGSSSLGSARSSAETSDDDRRALATCWKAGSWQRPYFYPTYAYDLLHTYLLSLYTNNIPSIALYLDRA